MKDRIVFEGKTSDNQNLIIRYLCREDAEKMAEYITTLSQERTYISYQGEVLTLDQERKNLAENLENIEKRKCVFLLAFIGDQLVGVTDADTLKRAESHVASMGITVAKAYRGKGIGSLLLKTLLAEIKNQLPQVILVILEVFLLNERAIAMYKKYGFVEYGHLPKGVAYKGNLEDLLYLYKEL
jgi:RimJ/RimL family protein N-acetyltransferase